MGAATRARGFEAVPQGAAVRLRAQPDVDDSRALTDHTRLTIDCDEALLDVVENQMQVRVPTIELTGSLLNKELEPTALLPRGLLNMLNQLAQPSNHGVEAVSQNSDFIPRAIQVEMLLQVSLCDQRRRARDDLHPTSERPSDCPRENYTH